MGLEIARGLAHLHSHNYVHRWLPGGPRGRVCVGYYLKEAGEGGRQSRKEGAQLREKASQEGRNLEGRGRKRSGRNQERGVESGEEES